jgi:hypothetical protein
MAHGLPSGRSIEIDQKLTIFDQGPAARGGWARFNK